MSTIRKFVQNNNICGQAQMNEVQIKNLPENKYSTF